ncbi:MAG: hypothetical protein A2075_23995 [Geobacteraceae bacterium GWC2_58_44]|nr:MAG: hypothetical protein A2075_23995 [Geobacteraceae bacterium GWC2_58_44]HBG05093.1 hypothetical protein [Geobacter sp.]
MRKVISILVLIAIAAMGILSFGTTAEADEIKFVGVITKIEIAGKDATTATVTLKDNKTEEPVVITVSDDLTLDKFKDHRIAEGDEIRCKYEPVEGKNVSKLFRKTAGC